MSDEYVGEIRWFPYMRGAPSNWVICDGSTLSISSYPVLYQLLGTTYGGDGNTTFGVPDLRGRVPVHQGSGQGLTPRSIGQMDGTESVTLNTPQLPTHNHVFQASTANGSATSPGKMVPAALPAGVSMYVADPQDGSPVDMLNQMFGSTGSNASHDNTQPTLPILACICTNGMYPVRPS